MDLDWPFFDDHHRDLGARLEAWCDANLRDVDHSDTDEACRTLVRQLGEGGWLRYCVPASHGGVHKTLDVRSLAILRSTLARHDALADFAFAMQGLGSGTISLFGTDAQKADILPAVAAGEKIAAFALTEPRSGSDVANVETSAVETDDGWKIDGAKSYISNGGIADYYVLFARTGEAPGAKGLSAFLVPADTPGLDDSERIEVIAPHPLSALKFDDMRLPADALVGERGRGFQQAMATLDIFRTSVGAAALGFAQRAYEETLARVTSRKLGDGTLADSPVTQSTLADMALGLDSAGLLIARAGWVRDVTGRRNSREAAMAKLAATENAQAIIDQAVQLHGGLGVTKGVAVEALYRDIRALRIYEGASEVQKLVIAKSILSERG
ncbi:acyl-CoA dehydrogenase family protein [Sphingomicrobium aestuariivivum]|uniref:acyl-CoA dehydrogenase family protein n=1 Tax=Sphingomicrobium aestuariivivum TaxID=1582356 RepID=UPI001FD6F1D4|nr:acyl-CoA dehydrogenase family protein [Sphingomicrobium aestuariivivum]MCJ8191892.1 acyl-CoA dehydrogenase family protein [Sphingomicrobium aestuariivivum]